MKEVKKFLVVKVDKKSGNVWGVKDQFYSYDAALNVAMAYTENAAKEDSGFYFMVATLDIEAISEAAIVVGD